MMKNIYFNIARVIFFIIISLSMMSKIVIASENEKNKSFFESCPEAKMASMRDEVDNKIDNAIYSLATNTDVDSAISVLEEAAGLGKDKAIYHLGWFYMGGNPDRLDKDRGYSYFIKTKGSYELSAKILIAVLHAEGTLSIKKDIVFATEMFNQINNEVNSRREEYKNQDDDCSIAVSMRDRKIFYEDAAVLKGYAAKLGISLE
jgi:hypothetical protein